MSELPEAPDLVIVAVHSSLVNGVVEECGRKGVGAVVVVSAGFSEVGPEGRAMEDGMVDIAERYGMALVGPNCMGVISSHHKLYGTGFMLVRPAPGGASMVSQSGNLGLQLLVSAERRKGGVGKFIGVGNEAMIDAVDFINYLHTDPETNTIVAYMEGFDDGRRLLDVMKRTTLDKPVVVLRGGMSDYGKKAAASHTGALTSSTAVFQAAARQSGLIVVTDPDEFMDLTFALAYMPLPPGRRVAVATLGGGWGVLVSDEISRCGLQLAELSPDVIESLNKVLPPFWSHSNPVDMVATVTPGAPETVVETLVASEGVDAVIVMGVVGSMSESRRAITEIEGLKAACEGAKGAGAVCLRRRGAGRAGTERAGIGLHQTERDTHGPLLQAHRQHIAEAHEPGRLLRGGALLDLRSSLPASRSADPGQDGGLQRVSAEERQEPALLSRGASLPDGIARQIEAEGGRVTFARFMELALTHPTEGYYTRAEPLLGPQGHFSTAPRLLPFFNRAVARLLAELVDSWSVACATGAGSAGIGGELPGSVIELGGGEGDLAGAVLRTWEDTRPDLRSLVVYSIVEIGAGLRARQDGALSEARRQGWKVRWAADLLVAATGTRPCVILGNEFVDALPVHLVDVQGRRPREAWVTIDRAVGDGASGSGHVEARPTEIWEDVSQEAEAELLALFGTAETEALRSLSRDGVIEVRPALRAADGPDHRRHAVGLPTHHRLRGVGGDVACRRCLLRARLHERERLRAHHPRVFPAPARARPLHSRGLSGPDGRR